MALKSFSEKTAVEKNKISQSAQITATGEKKQGNKKDLKTSKKKHSSRSKSKEFHVRKRSEGSSIVKESLSGNNFLPTGINIPYILPPMSTYYPHYPNYTYPVTLNEWDPVIPLQNPVFSVPVIINPTQILTTQLYGYNCVSFVTQPVVSPVVSQVDETLTIPYTFEPLITYATDVEPPIDKVNGSEYYFADKHKILADENVSTYCNYKKEGGEQEVQDTIYEEKKQDLSDLLEFYLTLPKELFPAARTLYIDPNPVIDEFCKIPDLQHHAPWILDLEFGIPKSPITRPIPIYNVKFNSVNCKNTPDAIHPGFESCNQDFKRVFLFYYDCVVSTWYNGYMILNHDKSVENFQAWLLPPVQVLGMCWP